MKSKIKGRILCAAMLLCGAAIVVSSASAQVVTPPPPLPEHVGGQDGPGPGRGGMMDPEHRTHMMKERLGLSDAQATQVKAVLEDERTKSEALRAANPNADRQAMRPQMEGIRKDSETRIDAILTPDQKAKYDAMRAEQRGRGPGGPPPAGTPPPQTPPQQ